MKNAAFPIKALWLVFLLTLASPLLAQTVIPLEIAPQGHILVKAKINGVEGNFILDTGGGLLVLTKSFASKVTGLRQQDGGFTGFRATGERLDVDLFTAAEFAMADYRQKDVTLSVLDANLGGIDGLISLPSFRNQPFTLDLENKKLYLETRQSLGKRKKAGKTIPLQLEDSRGQSLGMFAYFVVNGKRTLLLSIDSGAGNNVFRLNVSQMAPLGIDAADTTRVTKIEKASELNLDFKSLIYKAQLPLLAAKDAPSVKVDNFTAQFVEGLIYDGIMSLNWMGKRITIDISHSEMIVE
ncbi:aspartyl protease family protein [Rufibacter sediminis]|uniref:Retropepsin-like domain-containing protein n=1 Tax=Rufibacter sediminis TaxID=2762756 RepID=A0ABR6VSS7_9BACT|nr:retropepsin-like aspartic protease [Rufibacter sediminis]MBC3539646.1 retropepsin-like domain-containing protein [Rufibacter sediminis]